MEPRSRPDVVAVVSAYAPDASTLRLLDHTATLVDRLVVVDDTGGPSSLSQVPLFDGADRVLLVNDTNVGLATSLNRGIAAARDMGARYVLTLDQDTELAAGFVERLVEHLESVQHDHPDVLVASSATRNGIALPYVHDGDGGQCALGLIQSGLLFDVRIFDRLGGFRDEFVIDALEQDFVMRMHQEGLHATLCPELDLGHHIGDQTTARLFGRTFILSTGHSEQRRYYITRNQLTWTRQYRAVAPAFARAGLLWLIWWVGCESVWRLGRRGWIKPFVRGYRDFRRGRMGLYRENWR